MPHPEQEHSLRIQLATALRERDEAMERERCSVGVLQRALAAARRECEELRALLLDVKADLGYAEWGTPEHGANLLQRIIAKHHPRLGAALAAPAAAAGEEK